MDGLVAGDRAPSSPKRKIAPKPVPCSSITSKPSTIPNSSTRRSATFCRWLVRNEDLSEQISTPPLPLKIPGTRRVKRKIGVGCWIDASDAELRRWRATQRKTTPNIFQAWRRSNRITAGQKAGWAQYSGFKRFSNGREGGLFSMLASTGYFRMILDIILSCVIFF